jgi:CDP-diacylglycerol--glycerol-3-phosphate 3-phosphatidyltransferase
MTKAQYLAAWRKSHSAPDNFVIRGFLTVVYFFARILISLRITPNGATFLGGMVGSLAAALVISGNWLWAAAIAAMSSLLDGVDGAIAEMTDRKTKFGSVLDAVVDRIVELVWFTSLIAWGADITAAVVLGLTILLMEYLRAKANSLGLSGAGLITIAERPTRVIMFAMLCIGVASIGTENQALSIGIWTLAGITWIAIVQLFLRFSNQLRHNSSR